MQIQPIMCSYNSSFKNKSTIEKNISSAIKEMELNTQDLRQITRELEKMKFNLEFKLLPFSSTAIKKDPGAQKIAEQLAQVDCALNILSPKAENTLK